MKEKVLQNQRRMFRSALKAAGETGLPSSVTKDEIDAHFKHIPLHYWGRVEQHDLVWHLKALHDFFKQLSRSRIESIRPIVEWRHYPDKKYSEALVCTWDRQGLFSKVAGSFALTGINIISADIYTRKDHLAVDLFKICDLGKKGVLKKSQMQKMVKTLERSLNGIEEMPFLKIFRKKFKKRGRRNTKTVIQFNNQSSDHHTILKIQTRDHYGLLYSILQVLTLNGFDVAQARISTQKNTAFGEFSITDNKHRKVTDHLRLATIRDLLVEMIAFFTNNSRSSAVSN